MLCYNVFRPLAMYNSKPGSYAFTEGSGHFYTKYMKKHRIFFPLPTFYIADGSIGFCWLWWMLSKVKLGIEDKKEKDSDFDYYHKIANENRF